MYAGSIKQINYVSLQYVQVLSALKV